MKSPPGASLPSTNREAIMSGKLAKKGSIESVDKLDTSVPNKHPTRYRGTHLFTKEK